MIEAVFAGFALLALLSFYFLESARAVVVTCFAGWLILPVGNFPAGSASSLFPFWITGTAVPSEMVLTKMWWPPAVAIVGVLLTDRKALWRFEPNWTDIPVALWCIWPIGGWAYVQHSDPQPWISSLYLLGAWGAPWLLGRIYFSGVDGARRLMTALATGLVVIAPIALIEGVLGPRVYGWLYEPHPFRLDGQERYFGFRPLAFFEHGNQYGIWVAATALAAIWLWRHSAETRAGFWAVAVAALASLVAVASQSVGAIFLLCAGLVFCWAIEFQLVRRIMLLSLLATLIGGAVYLSGKVPLRDAAEHSAIGRRVLDLVQTAGRGSFTWRIARDQSALNLIRQHPIVGTEKWDWWQENGQRPWGLWLLILGQFGLIGLLLAYGTLVVPILTTFTNYRWLHSHRAAGPLASVILMAVADAQLNSFFFYPAILAAGALTSNLSRSLPQGSIPNRGI